MKPALCQIDLGNEQANYTIGQLLTHLKLLVDYSDYEKVEKHLRRREERAKEEARKEMEEAVVRRYETKLEEVMKWKVKVEENVVKFEEDVRVLRKRRGVVDEGVSVSGLLALKGNVEPGKGNLRLGEVKVEVAEGFQKVGSEKSDLLVENVRFRKEVRECREMFAALEKGAEVERLRS